MTPSRKSDTRRIRINLVVEIDPSAWNLVYGWGHTADQLAADARSYVVQTIRESGAAEEHALVSVEVLP